MPANEGTREARSAARILQATLSATSAADEVVFIPGSHDWNHSRRGGHARIVAQGALIRRVAGQEVAARLLPPDGCPGPVSLDIASVARLLIIDTEWLLMADDPRRKPVGPMRACTHGPAATPAAFPDNRLTRETFYGALEAQLQDAGSRAIVLLAHHPLRSRGSHSGYMSGGWLPYVWPAIRRAFVTRQDFASRVNRQMRERVDDLLRGTRANLVIAAAGHDHNLQVLDGPAGVYYLVSGSGSKKSPAGRDSSTMYKHGTYGYMRLDFLADGTVYLNVMDPTARRAPWTVRLQRRG